MTNKFVAVFVAALTVLGLSRSSDAAIVFSAISKNVGFGTTLITTEIRVTGVGSEALQYFGVTANITNVTLSGGKTVSFTAQTQDGTATNRSPLTGADYILFDRGTSATLVTKSGSSFAFNGSASSVNFRDGVSVPGISGGSPPPSTGVAPGAGLGRLVATLNMQVSSGLTAGDKFDISLSPVLSVSADAFAQTSPFGGIPADLVFSTGAADGRTGTVQGDPINAQFTLGSITAVPEPSTFAMLGLAFGIFGAAKFRKRLAKLVC